MKILLINTDDGPDYLSDLINYYFISKNYDIYTNHNLNFLFNDYKNKSELYGKGFTIYGKLDKKLKDNIQKYGIRNSLLLAPMPTASTSQILGNNECIEPFTSNIYLRRTLAGEFVVINKYLIKVQA